MPTLQKNKKHFSLERGAKLCASFEILCHFFFLKKGCTNQSKLFKRGFPGGALVENLPANAGDIGSSPGLGRSHVLRSN